MFKNKNNYRIGYNKLIMGQAAVKKEGQEEKEEIFFVRGTEKVEFMIMIGSIVILTYLFLELKSVNSKAGFIS